LRYTTTSQVGSNQGYDFLALKIFPQAASDAGY